jgi:hypothetical protein
MGHTVTGDVANADVLINCHGCGIERLPEHTFNVLWIIGHPDRITPAECQQYDAVYSESARFAEHLRGQGVACTHLPGASDFVPMPDAPKTHGAVFVGNWRPGRTLDAGERVLSVWGEGWDGKLPEGAWWQGLYFPHGQLNALYAGAEVLPNDHHADMERWGFHNPRHYDTLAVRGEEVPTFEECAGHIMDPIPEERVMLDLGCGQAPRRGFIGLDKIGGVGVKAWDLEAGLPPDIFGARVIIADNIFEHITNLIPLLNDCHTALLALRGRLHVTVPNALASPEAAFSDPTHVRCFTPQTFDYFNGEHPRWQEYGQQYGILPWRVVYVRQRERFIEAMLRPWVATPALRAETPEMAVTITAERVANSRAYGDRETVVVA